MNLLERTWDHYSKCTKCPLHNTRNSIVFGNGNPNADIFIIKGSPTQTEEAHTTYLTPDLKFMVSCYRRALNKRMSLEASGQHLLDNCFITSSIICRPTYDKGAFIGQDRPKYDKEASACSTRLYRTIYAVDPKIIICFGKYAISQIVCLNKSTAKPRQTGEIGELFTTYIPGVSHNVPYSVIPAPDIIMAEVNGDYDYEAGRVMSVVRAFESAISITSNLNNEDPL